MPIKVVCDPPKATEKTRKRRPKKISVYAEAAYAVKPKTDKNIPVKLRRTDPNKTYIFKLLPLFNAEREIFTSAPNALLSDRVKAISFSNFGRSPVKVAHKRLLRWLISFNPGAEAPHMIIEDTHLVQAFTGQVESTFTPFALHSDKEPDAVKTDISDH
jgi:hypothetical protein